MEELAVVDDSGGGGGGGGARCLMDGDGARRPPGDGERRGVLRGDGARLPRGVVTRVPRAPKSGAGLSKTFGRAFISFCLLRSAFLLAGLTPPLACASFDSLAGSTRGETGTDRAFLSASADKRANRLRSTDAARLL